MSVKPVKTILLLLWCGDTLLVCTDRHYQQKKKTLWRGIGVGELDKLFSPSPNELKPPPPLLSISSTKVVTIIRLHDVGSTVVPIVAIILGRFCCMYEQGIQ